MKTNNNQLRTALFTVKANSISKITRRKGIKRFGLFTSMMLVLGFSTFANAVLVYNGGGLIYDTVQNITWYDYTYQSTSWGDAMSWAANLNEGGVTGWYLPTVPWSGGGYLNFYSDGGQFGYLWYDELGNTANGPPSNMGPFKSLFSVYPANWDTYWVEPEMDGSRGYVFCAYNGFYTDYWKSTSFPSVAAMAVHSGDVVPEPTSLALLGVGTLGLLTRRR